VFGDRYARVLFRSRLAPIEDQRQKMSGFNCVPDYSYKAFYDLRDGASDKKHRNFAGGLNDPTIPPVELECALIG
jgi:hypothetical protein